MKEIEFQNNLQLEKEKQNYLIVLILGPSGVGKSTLIKHMLGLDPRLKIVTSYTTRELREGETEKRNVSIEEYKELEANNHFLISNEIYGNYYGTPRSHIDNILANGEIPILDFPLHKVKQLSEYSDSLYKVYVTPPSLGTLKKRLEIDRRAYGNTRYEEARDELLSLVKNHFAHPHIDDVIINTDIQKGSFKILNNIHERLK